MNPPIRLRFTLPFARAVFLALFLGLAASAEGRIPALQVTVFGADQKVAFQGPLGSDGSFATGGLAPGKYVVQFKTKNTAAQNNLYLLVLSSGTKKVIAAAVPGQKFTGGGVAMKVEVRPSFRIAGQVVQEDAVTGRGVSRYRVIGGKRYVWMTIGSNLGARWVEERFAPALNVVNVTMDSVRTLQDGAGEGSMLTRSSYLIFRGVKSF